MHSKRLRDMGSIIQYLNNSISPYQALIYDLSKIPGINYESTTISVLT